MKKKRVARKSIGILRIVRIERAIAGRRIWADVVGGVTLKLEHVRVLFDRDDLASFRFCREIITFRHAPMVGLYLCHHIIYVQQSKFIKSNGWRKMVLCATPIL